MELVPAIQKYDWGKLGKDSLVAKFSALDEEKSAAIDPAGKYAELWMG